MRKDKSLSRRVYILIAVMGFWGTAIGARLYFLHVVHSADYKERAERQQQVIQAIAGKLASAGTYLDLPFIGDDLLRPLATDLTPSQMLQLGWVYWRSGSGRALHCRLGGQPDGGHRVGGPVPS